MRLTAAVGAMLSLATSCGSAGCAAPDGAPGAASSGTGVGGSATLELTDRKLTPSSQGFGNMRLIHQSIAGFEMPILYSCKTRSFVQYIEPSAVTAKPASEDLEYIDGPPEIGEVRANDSSVMSWEKWWSTVYQASDTQKQDVNNMLKRVCGSSPLDAGVAEITVSAQPPTFRRLLIKEFIVRGDHRIAWFADYPGRLAALKTHGVRANDALMHNERNSLEQIDFDCLSRRYKLLTSVKIDQDGSYRTPLDLAGDFTPIVPDTISEQMLNFVCAID